MTVASDSAFLTTDNVRLWYQPQGCLGLNPISIHHHHHHQYQMPHKQSWHTFYSKSKCTIQNTMHQNDTVKLQSYNKNELIQLFT